MATATLRTPSGTWVHMRDGTVHTVPRIFGIILFPIIRYCQLSIVNYALSILKSLVQSQQNNGLCDSVTCAVRVRLAEGAGELALPPPALGQRDFSHRSVLGHVFAFARLSRCGGCRRGSPFGYGQNTLEAFARYSELPTLALLRGRAGRPILRRDSR